MKETYSKKEVRGYVKALCEAAKDGKLWDSPGLIKTIKRLADQHFKK